MATQTTLLTVSVVIEEDASVAERVPFPLRAEEEVRKAILAAVAVLLSDSDRPDIQVEWSSMPLDGATGYGRCAVCNRWVYDAELADEERRGGVTRGAMINGSLRCDEHLPPGHPLCFASLGYDGPVPE